MLANRTDCRELQDVPTPRVIRGLGIVVVRLSLSSAARNEQDVVHGGLRVSVSTGILPGASRGDPGPAARRNATQRSATQLYPKLPGGISSQCCLQCQLSSQDAHAASRGGLLVPQQTPNKHLDQIPELGFVSVSCIFLYIHREVYELYTM